MTRADTPHADLDFTSMGALIEQGKTDRERIP